VGTGADLAGLALDIALGAGCVAAISIGIGATAPRWPDNWLRRDRGPLRLLPGDDVQRYKRLGAEYWKPRFPELGTVFGGKSKQDLPDLSDPDDIHAYLREVRRAEWVHWLADLVWLPLLLFQPVWLAALFALVSVAVNGIAQIILRYNRLRLYGVLDRLGAPREG
jgi:hypothetical protein